MGLTSENGLSAADVAAVMGNGNSWGGFGGEGWWLLIIILFALGGGWGMNGMNGYGGGMFPWLLAGQANQGNDVQRGFDQAAITGAVNAVGAQVSALSPQLCNGFAGVNATVNAGFAGAEAAANARQIANMQQAFGAQTALTSQLNTMTAAQQQCCCDTRAGIADVKYTIATENCADRYEAAQNTRDIIENCNRNNQAVLDKLCALELDGVKAQLAAAERENVSLQNQLNMATMQASQNAQTAALVQDNNAQTAQLIQRIAPYPTPSYQVPNPYAGCGYSACGCGMA